ncbi:MAG: OmpA family protein, partial [Bacteroides sp.]|nr:OmpA family protein [Bacteroides sp.]
KRYMKKVCMLLAFAGLCAASFAQGSYGYDSNTIDRHAVVTSPGRWFFSVGGGVEVLLGNGDAQGDFGDRISRTFNAAISKWFSPVIGLRLMYSGIQAKGYSSSPNSFSKGQVAGTNYYKQNLIT